MPIPEKRPDENKDDFLQRCMSDDIMSKEFPDNDKRLAICQSRIEKPDESLADIQDLLNSEYVDVEGIEVFNQFPNQHNIPFDDKFFNEIIENFEEYKGKYTPNIKVDHSGEQAILKELLKSKNVEKYTELPLLGTVKKLYQKGKSLYADFEKVPKLLKPVLFSGKYFKSTSPEFTRSFRDTGKKLLQAVSLTNRASQRHIMDVSLSGVDSAEGIFFSGKYKINDKEFNMSDKDKDLNDLTTDEGQKSFMSKMIDAVTEKLSTKPDPPKDKDIDKNATISLSDFEAYKTENDKVMNELKLKIIEKDESQTLLSEQIVSIQDEARSKNAESICKTAMLNGVPKIVVNYCKPILDSALSDNTFKMSAIVDDKKVEADKTVRDFIEGLFKVYPDKVVLSDMSYTTLNEPGEEKDDYDKIEERAKVLMSENPEMERHAALMQAGVDVAGGDQ